MGLIRKYFALGLAISLALGAGFAFLGVYDTSELPFFKRFVFWTSTMIAGTLANAFAAPWALNGPLRKSGPFIQILVTAAAISLPVTIVIAFFNTGIGLQAPPAYWLQQYGFVIVISLLIVSVGYVSLRALGQIGGGTEYSGPAPEQKFLERLPVKYRGAALYAVSSEDHYCRVHTNCGEALILLRLADALRELDGADGLQVHRSWWVSRNGVADAEREGGKQTLKLKSGGAAPVSRSFAKAAKEAGLF